MAYRRTEKPDEMDLASTIAPHLTHDPGRHYQDVAVVQRPGHEADDAPVVAFEADQGAGVEHGTAQRPSTRSASADSSAVSGPPVPASISSNRDARSSSLLF